MATKQQSIDAITIGAKRADCNLISINFSGRDITFIVKGTRSLNQIGREFNYQQLSASDIRLRTYRFCNHFANGKPYRLGLRDDFLDSI